MKILIISDSSEILNHLTLTNSTYSFRSIQIDFIELLDNKIGDIEEKIKLYRYHLILIISQAKFIGEFVRNTSLVNTVNNYKIIDEKLLNIVNKTTSYFNIYLEIPKAVSLTINKYTEGATELKRLDIICNHNYPIAKICSEIKANYYILNYRNSFPIGDIIDLLQKME